MKQGKTEKAVFAKLSTEKVELASAKELNQLYKQIDRKIDSIKSNADKGVKANQTLRKAMENGRSTVKDFRSSITDVEADIQRLDSCLLYTSPSPRDGLLSRMPSSA